VKILLHGCNGKMGQVITGLVSDLKGSEDLEIVCGVDSEPSKIQNTYPVYARIWDIPDGFLEDARPDVIVDFSHHTSIRELLDFALSRRIPIVIGTTGFTAEEISAIVDASHNIPVLMSANMSLGINLLISLVTQASAVLKDSFDIEIVEKHHNQKADSPSGTALMIADAINATYGNKLEYVYGRSPETGKRNQYELGIHSVRGGSIVGEHDVIFAGQGEVIQVSHTVLSRDVFGYGAISAARFIIEREPGLYDMQDVVKFGLS